MTTPTNLDAAREQARQDNGKFGAQPLAEVNIDNLFDGTADQSAGPVELDLSEMGSSAADLLMEQVEMLRREAYEAGQRDAYEKAAVLIHDFVEPSSALVGHVLKHPEGKFQMEVPDENAYDMADHVLKAASDSLSAYAAGGFKTESAAYVGAGQPAAAAAPVPGDTIQCPKCADHPGWGRRVSDTLVSGTCDACNGSSNQTVPGDNAVECTYCYGSAMTDSTTECPVCVMGKMAPTPSGQEEVFVPGRGTFYRSGLHTGDGVFPSTPYAIRLEANRALTDDEMQRAAQLLGYNYRASIAGEPLGDLHADSDRSFIVSADSTKSRRDDLGVAFEEFEDNLGSMLNDGSPVRKTDKAGPGTKDTRLVEGLGDPGLVFTPYYDDVD